MGAEVFNSFDVDIEITKLITKTESYTSDFIIDNKGNRRVYPILEITTADTLTLNIITNNNQTITFNSISLTSSDTLILNFKEQVYEKNGSNIIDNITDIDLIYLEANIENNFSFDYSGNLNVDVTYDTYSISSREKYVENFKINRSDSYNKKKPFNSNKKNEQKRVSTDYTLTMGKMPINWDSYDDIENEEEFRITYYEYNDYTYEEEKRYLVGVKFNSWDRGFDQQGDFIMTNVSGEALDILKH
jgi:hypothetical protein